ncbi:hypothetical protein AVEN_182679-1, partial [Araneus ventricosus]
EVGLSEIFVPRTWFNIGNHNNKYSITYEETKIVEKDYVEYDIRVKIDEGTTDEDVIDNINQSIEEKCGHFVLFALDHRNINVHTAPNYELHLTAADAPRLLTMLNLPREDRIIKTSESFVFRKPSKTNKDNVLKIIARNLKRHFIIRTTRFNHKYTDMDNLHHELFQHINFNLMQTGIGGAADFIFDFKEDKVEITVQKNVELEFRNINVHTAPNYELHLTAADAPRLLTMLNLPREDRIIKTSESFVFRKPSKTNKDNVLKIIARNLKRHFIIRTTRFNHKYTDMDNLHHELFQHINFNLMQTGIGGAADFIFDFKEDKVEITVQKNVELEFRLLYAPIFMRMLSMTKDVVLTGKTLHVLQKVDRPPLNEYFRVSITDKPTIPEKVKKTEHLELEVGFYKNSEQLFSSFKHLAFNHLANNKVKIHIPDTSTVNLQDGLRDLLGFKKSTLYGGTHISDYQLELDGGITEIYVYSDIIESHFVGDTIAPLLRIIPVMSTKEDQIVINYQRPLYFPLRKNYIDCIEIELKSSSGDGIIFTSGKSLLVLSFRRRTV